MLSASKTLSGDQKLMIVREREREREKEREREDERADRVWRWRNNRGSRGCVDEGRRSNYSIKSAECQLCQQTTTTSRFTLSTAC